MKRVPIAIEPSTQCIAPAVIAEIVAGYRRHQAVWRCSPRVAEVLGRLRRAQASLAAARESFGELRSPDLRCAGLDADEATAGLGTMDWIAASLATALDDLAARGAGSGGARRLEALFERPPRLRAALELRAAYVAAGIRPTRARLVAGLEEILLAAGDPAPSGIDDVVRALPSLGEN